jgi:hypothetical protein
MKITGDYIIVINPWGIHCHSGKVTGFEFSCKMGIAKSHRDRVTRHKKYITQKS